MNKLFTRFVDSVGDETGDLDLIGNYSGSPTIFKMTAQPGEHLWVARCMVSMRAGTIGQITGYGGGPALTLGMAVFVTDAAGTLQYYLTSTRESIKTNAGYGAVSYDGKVIPGFASGDDVFHCRWTFAKYGAHKDFEGVELLPGWSICVLGQDDLSVGTSGLLRHIFIMEGHFVDDSTALGAIE